ncbi:MAG TPA: TetR/AcrR family transcriptional regulator [Terriglobales bacterium]|nr:TetR/AcrR family transcriptional regulator [Terriglobales bacterium]
MARTRSAEAHAKVLLAAAELFAERGIETTSMDAIAASSGVSKATLYKHWPDKDALCLEAMAMALGLNETLPVFDTGDFRADLIAQLSFDPGGENREMRCRLMPHVMAYSATNRAFGRAWRMRILAPARKLWSEVIHRGQRLGVLRAKIDIEFATAMLVGPKMYQRIFVDVLGGSVPKHFEASIVDAFLAAFGASSARPSEGAPRRAGKKA